MELGKRMKDLRMKRGITQEALAGALGVTPQTVSKWENDVTMPDIALLPEISIFFGVTIDELFSLTTEKQMERIDHRLSEAALLSENEANQMEETLKEFAKNPKHQGEALTLLSNLHAHQSEVHKRLAAEYAKEAIYAVPESHDAMSLFCNSMDSYIPDWNVRNHHELIEELYAFLKVYPDNRMASMWLLDNLMADRRLAEAERELERLVKVDASFRTPLYRELLAEAKGDCAAAEKYRKEMEETYGEDWLVQLSLGDLATCRGDYEEAISYYKEALERQPTPKYADAPEAMAHIYEILGQKEKAVEAYRLMLKVMKDDWGMIAGEEVEKVTRRIHKLLED